MTDEEIIRWFRHIESPGGPTSYAEFAKIKFPKQIRQDISQAYIGGVMDCADAFVSMYRKGYVRATETYNFIMHWMQSRLIDDCRLLQDEHEAVKSWNETRRKVLARDDNKCTICGSCEEIEIHHIKSVRDGGWMNLENLTAVCFKCHRERNDETANENKAIHSKRS